MATFTSLGDNFVQSENRLAASRRGAIGRVVSDTSAGAGVGGALGPGQVSSGGNLTKQNEILADFLKFTAIQQSGQGNNPSLGGRSTSGGGGSGLNLSGPSALLRSSGSVSRRFDTSGVDTRGASTVGRGGVGGGGGSGGSSSEFVQASQSKTDIQPVLEDLLAQLVSQGGTPQAQQNSGTRQAAAAELLNTVQTLTPANAESRAIAAVDLVVQRALEQALPQLQASGESAGTSTNALQSLAINDLATRTAGTTAAVILESITNFASAQAAAGGAVEGLTGDDPVSNELIRLITGTPTETGNVSAGANLDILQALGIQFDEEENPFASLFSSGPGPVAPAPGGGGGPVRIGG